MSQKPIAQKLVIKEGYKVLLVNSPPDYLPKLGKLPTRATITTESMGKSFDIVQLFVTSKGQLEEHLPKMKQLLNKNGILWTTYPKGKVEINRDSIREYASTLGFQAVSLVAIDETWSALRLKMV